MDKVQFLKCSIVDIAYNGIEEVIEVEKTLHPCIEIVKCSHTVYIAEFLLNPPEEVGRGSKINGRKSSLILIPFPV